MSVNNDIRMPTGAIMTLNRAQMIKVLFATVLVAAGIMGGISYQYEQQKPLTAKQEAVMSGLVCRIAASREANYGSSLRLMG